MDTRLTRSDAVEDALAGPQPWRRLFLDAMVVEESKALKRVFHSAEKHPDNPILRYEKPWEGIGVCVSGTVMWMGDKLTMRYRCWGKGAAKACYAESYDGIHWEKPTLGFVEWDGSCDNNITIGGTGSIVKIRHPKSERDRWALFSYQSEKGATVVFSEDTFNWRWEEQRTNLFETSDVVKFFYDPYEDRYVATYKTPNRRHRAVGIALSKDGLEWYKPYSGAVVGADDLDPDATQFYGMPVFPYQGMYIGLPWIYHARWMKYGNYESPKQMYEAQEGSPRTVDVQLAWSWNLIQWTRTPDRKPFINLGPKGTWDWGMIYTARNPVIVDDKLYFYYYGCDNVHDIIDDVRCNIGLATLRMDGFCSMRAGNREGWFISRREVFKTPRVTINAKVMTDGYIIAELLDRWNKVIPGFSRSECIPFTGDSIEHVMEWKTKAFPAEFLDADKKIRFYLKNADIYSYLPVDIDTTRDQGNRKEQ